VRNQRLKAHQEMSTSSNLADLGWVAARTRDTLLRGTPGLVDVAGPEAAVNVGTIPVVPNPGSCQLFGGTARRRLMLPGWGGGPVVVRGRESRLHGEGVVRHGGVLRR
jgi:hypothetical protein